MRNEPDGWWCGFPFMHQIVPEGTSGSLTVRHFRVTRTEMMLALMGGDRQAYTPEDYTYCGLFEGSTTWMSDTMMERQSNLELLERATGDVLIAGLGLGMVVHPLARNPSVRSVTVVERNADVITLVRNTLPPGTQVVEADIFDWRPAPGTRYATIYFDIWPNRSEDNLDQLKELKRRFRRHYLRPRDGRTWCKGWFEDQLRADRRRSASAWW